MTNRIRDMYVDKIVLKSEIDDTEMADYFNDGSIEIKHEFETGLASFMAVTATCSFCIGIRNDYKVWHSITSPGMYGILVRYETAEADRKYLTEVGYSEIEILRTMLERLGVSVADDVEIVDNTAAGS